MFDPNPLNNVPDEIKSMYSKAFEAANSGMSDAFKDLPKHMQDALDSAGIKDILDNWGMLSDKVKDAKKQLDEKVKSMKKIIDMTEELNELLRDQAEIEIDMVKEERDKATTLQDFLKKQDTVDRTTARWNTKLANSGGLLNKMKQSYMGVSNAHAALNANQNTFTKGQAASTLLVNAFGRKWTGLATTFRSLTSGGLAMFAALGKGIGLVTAQLGDAYQVSRNMGYGVTQSISNIGTGIGDWIESLRTGVISSVKEQVELRNLYSREFGTRAMDDDLQKTGVRAMKLFRLTAAETSKMQAGLLRNSRFNAKAAASDIRMIENTANANDLEPGELMKSIARDSQIFATYAERGTAAFIKSEIAVRKAGLTMQSVAGFADRMVNDFESSLMMQAKIQTVMPGADFSEVMYASQFGSEEDITAALQSALGGRNIMSLPRSLRNMISQTTGLGMEELRNLDRGNDPNAKATVIGDSKDNSSFTENFIGSIDKSITQLNLFSAALVVATARLGTSFIGNTLGGVAKTGVAAATKIGAAAPIVGGVISGGMSAVGQYSESKAVGRTTGQSAMDAGIRGVGAGGGAIGGAIGGAAVGAALGSIVPLIGTAIGGIAGGIIGGLGGGMLGDYAGKAAVNKLREPTEVRHSGGLVGQGFRQVRNVDPTVFDGAPKFHKGLMPDEVPSILQRGEAVLSRTQLSGLTNLMRSTQALGKVGDQVGNIKLDGIVNFGEGVSSLAKTFTSSKMQGFSALTSGSGGMTGMIGDFINQKTGGIMESVTNMFKGQSGGITGAISGMLGGKSGGLVSSITGGISNLFGGKSGGITGAISGLFGGNKSGGISGAVSGMLGGKSGGITGAISGLFGGKKSEGVSGIQGLASNLLGGKGGGIVSALTGKGGIQGFASSKLKGVASNFVSKIPGVGGIASSLLKGGGAKGIIGNVGKSLAGKAIGTKVGAALGSVVPGLGTLVGAGVGALASKYGGKLIGGVKNIATKIPGVGTAAKVVSGVAGKAVGGIKKLFGFGKKKKPAVVAQEQPQMVSPEMSALNSSIGQYTGTVFGTPSDGGAGAQPVVKVDNSNLENLLTQLLAATKEGKDIYLDGKKVGNSLVNAYSRDT